MSKAVEIDAEKRSEFQKQRIRSSREKQCSALIAVINLIKTFPRNEKSRPTKGDILVGSKKAEGLEFGGDISTTTVMERKSDGNQIDYPG